MLFLQSSFLSGFTICTTYFRFCKANSPNITIGNRKDLTILFTSDMEETGGGAQCTAECVGENDEKTTTLQSAGKTSLPYFGVKLSCVCLIFA